MYLLANNYRDTMKLAAKLFNKLERKGSRLDGHFVTRGKMVQEESRGAMG